MSYAPVRGTFALRFEPRSGIFKSKLNVKKKQPGTNLAFASGFRAADAHAPPVRTTRSARLSGSPPIPGAERHALVDQLRGHPQVKSWLRRRPRFHIHFTPTSASALNMVERFFRDPTTKPLQRSTFTSVGKLIESIEAYLRGTNETPKPFV